MMFDIAECAADGIEALERRGRQMASGAQDRPLGPVHVPRVNPGEPAAFVYDGTLEGLLTAVYCAYATHTDPEDVVPAGNLQPRLGQQVVAIETSFDAALRVRRSLCNSCGQAVWHAVAMASAADDPRAGTLVHRFIRYALADKAQGGCGRCPRKERCTEPCTHPRGTGVLAEWANPAVEPVLALQRRVANEVEKMKQFVRFQHTEEGLWFARCNPNANVVPLVMDHFARRLNTQRFIIYDEVHRVAGLSEAGRWEVVRIDNVAVPPPAPDEAQMQEAWRRFYRSLSIEARYNPELRRHFMPVRLWRNLTEMQEEAR